MIDWEQYRREDRTIDLKKAFGENHMQGDLTMAEWSYIVQYFRGIEILQRINSRQAAAVAIANARIYLQQYRFLHT